MVKSATSAKDSHPVFEKAEMATEVSSVSISGTDISSISISGVTNQPLPVFHSIMNLSLSPLPSEIETEVSSVSISGAEMSTISISGGTNQPLPAQETFIVFHSIGVFSDASKSAL